jgi:imidazolonepropionase-like amidohydrolase
MPHASRLFPIALFVISLTGSSSTASAQPLTAIIGVRIIDGSGNEPFVGTVLMEGGRIRAAGRSVDVPAGAVTIDGAGRTVLPGLIDVRLPVDGSDRPERVSRAMAAALYSGVTSAGVSGVAPDRFDAVRALSGRADGGPRVLLVGTLKDATTGTPEAGSAAVSAAWARILRAGVQAISLPASAPAGESVAADARSRGLRVMVEARGEVALDRLLAFEPSLVIGTASLTSAAGSAALLPQRNVTVAPDLVHAAGRTPPVTPLSEELAAASATPAPSATETPASGASPSAGNPTEWSARVAEVRALRDARIRLAVASDVGDPPLPAGWATQSVVQLLVSAGVPPLEAVTAATSGGAWALGLQSDRGFLAAGMRADVLMVQGDPSQSAADLARIDRVFLGGVEVDRPALLAKIRSVSPALAPPTAAAVAPTDTALVKGAAKKDTAASERSVGRRRGRDRKASPPATAAPVAPGPTEAAAGATPPPVTAPASGTPPATTATPASDAPAPSPAAPVSTPAATPAAPVEAPAAAAAAPAVAAAVRLDDPLIDDFERSGNGDALGSAWSAAANDGAAATIVLGRVVRGLRDHALHLTARMGQGAAPFVRAAMPLSREGRPVDVSRFRGIRFDARGEGRYRIVFVTRDVADGRYHESYFSGSPIWTPVGIPFASIGQNGKGGHAPFTGRDLIEIRFEVARDAGQLAWLELDNVRFY